MKLSIITINYNNAEGLRKTLASVSSQSLLSRKETDFAIEHIIVDGGSNDESVDVIKDYEKQMSSFTSSFSLIWVSERDNGIYHAMNKGILISHGNYIQILNSGDILASNHVIEDCRLKIEELNYPELMYGNMIRQRADGIVEGKSREVPYSLLNYYSSTMNHDCCWIKHSLFNQYGLYDENIKIVSDWKWFLQAIGLGHVKPVYVDIDMTIFDTTGISERNLELRAKERRKVLEDVLSPAVLADYDRFAFPMEQVKRLKKYHLWRLVYVMERVLFKLEKWHILK